MRDILLTGVTLYFLLKVFSRPYIGVYLWTWFSLMNPHRLTYGFAYSFPFAELIAGVTLISLLTGKQERLSIWSRETVVLLLLIIWVCITTAFAASPEGAQHQLDRFLKIQVFTFLTVLLISDKEKLDRLVWIIVVSIGFYSLKGGLFTILSGGANRVYGPEGSFIGENNALALATLMTVPLMWYLYSQARARWLQLGLLAGMFLSAASILGSQSRGAFIGIITIGVFFWLKSRKKALATLIILLVSTLVMTFMPSSWWERMETMKTYQQDSSAEGRLIAWRFAWNVGNHRLLGGGANMFESDELRQQFSPDPSSYHDLHSIYFEMQGEQGWIGFILFITLGLMTWFRCSRITRETKSVPELHWAADLALMIQVSLIGYATAGAFLGLAYFDYPYDLVALTVITWKLLGKIKPSLSAASVPEYRLDNSATG